MITQIYKLDMVPGGMPQIIHVSQYDAGSRDLTFELYNGAMPWKVPTGATVTIDGTKPDRKAFSIAATASGATVTATVTQQMTAATGRAKCQLTVTSGSNVLGSANFILDVERAALTENADMSATDISSVETAKTQAIDAMQKAQAAQAAAEAATSEKADKSTGLWGFPSIPANSDLNDYTACGYYSCGTTAAVATLSNCPTTRAFTMRVFASAGGTNHDKLGKSSWVYRVQQITGLLGEQYTRDVHTDSSGNTVFGEWEKTLYAGTALATLGISTGSWTPTLSGMSSYSYQKGRYLKIGDVVIVSFTIWGDMAGSNSEQIKISGCPFTPANGGYAGGGSLSGYYTTDNVTFCGWAASTDGDIYAYGQLSGTGNKWQQSGIYQKTSGGCGAGGTIMFKTSS